MNPFVVKLVTFASLTGTIAFSSGQALAQTAEPSAVPSPASRPDAEHHRHPGRHHGAFPALVQRALSVSSLSSTQRTSIEALEQTWRDGQVPARAAEARLLTTLAAQVEAGRIDPQAAAADMRLKESAELSARAVGRETMQKLHDVLTAAQRNELVDGLTVEVSNAGPKARPEGSRHQAGFGWLGERLGLSPDQKAQIASNLKAERVGDVGGEHRPSTRPDHRDWLESFRGDGFRAGSDAASPEAKDFEVAVDRRAHFVEGLLKAAVPVLTPVQRLALAGHLRARAAHGHQS